MFSFRLFRAAATLLAFASLMACSSKKEDSDPAPAAGMSWTVDGTTVSTTNVLSQKGSGTILVAGNSTSTGAYSYLSLQLPNAVGTYALGSSPATGTYAPGTTTDVYYAGALPSTSGQTTIGSGTIVVTTLTATNVTGTFAFTGVGPAGATKSVTNGTFNVGL